MSSIYLSLPETVERRAVEEILAGSRIPKSLWPKIAHIASRGGRDCLLPVLGAEDFHWPWFDQWRARFEADTKWPECWECFEDDAPPYRKVGDVLRVLTAPKLRALARELGIDMGDAKKVDEMRVVLVRKVKWDSVARIAAGMNAEAQAKVLKQRIRAKRELLARSIASRAYSLHRHGQIVDLLNDVGPKWTVLLEDIKGCPIAKQLRKGWRFNTADTTNLPPFFPGDRTSIRTQRD